MIFDGKQLAAEIKLSIADDVRQCQQRYGREPCLAVLLVGNDYGSERYVASCEKQLLSIGMNCQIIRMPQETTEQDSINQLKELNNDKEIDGILIQMPLPKHISQAKIVSALDPKKDVDGITDFNIARLWTQKGNDYTHFCVPCTPYSALRILRSAHIPLEGKNVVVIGRSNIVGMPVSKLMLNENATVTITHSRTNDLPSILRQADIIIAAIGQPRFITDEMVSDGAVVIDIGINSDPQSGKMCGDVDFENIAHKCSLITPVPGGVGPLTICSLMENTLKCFINNQINLINPIN